MNVKKLFFFLILAGGSVFIYSKKKCDGNVDSLTCKCKFEDILGSIGKETIERNFKFKDGLHGWLHENYKSLINPNATVSKAVGCKRLVHIGSNSCTSNANVQVLNATCNSMCHIYKLSQPPFNYKPTGGRYVKSSVRCDGDDGRSKDNQFFWVP